MRSLKRELVGLVWRTALALLIVPLLALVFIAYGQHTLDAQYLESIDRDIGHDVKMLASDRAALKAVYERHLPSSVCGSEDPEFAKYREAVCEEGSPLWQFRKAEQVSWFALLLGIGALASALALAALAFAGRTGQYWSLRVASVELKAAAAVELVVQAVLLIWLSFWGTAIFFHVYVVKLIMIVAILALVAVWTALRAIFAKLPPAEPKAAEPLTREDAPKLWEHVTSLAERVQTPPPDHVFAGIDDNFFVTESEMNVAGRSNTGRMLYVSLPLLRILEVSEADAVLAHELAHFHGGDTKASAKLGPLLVRYDMYLSALGRGLALPAFYLLRMFRVLFELARRSESRRRELRADAVSSNVTSADALASALLKTSAYSSYRTTTEAELFSRNDRIQEAIGFGERIRAGLHAHTTSVAFKEALQTERVPHPFDTHPPLEERLRNVETSLTLRDVERLVARPPESTWLGLIDTAESLEARMWEDYEGQFTMVHEMSLAFRYLPSTDEERAVVARFFPPKTFALKKGGGAELTHEMLKLPGEGPILLSAVATVIRDENFSDTLRLTYTPGHAATVAKIKLSTFVAKEEFVATFASYWQRTRTARAYVAKERSKAA